MDNQQVKQITENSKKIEGLQRITANIEKEVAVSGTKIDAINQSVLEIKNNHLLHINDSLGTIQGSMVKNQADMTQMVTNEIGKIYAKIAELKVTDAKQEPAYNIVSEGIKYELMAIIGAALVLLINR